MCVGVGVGGCGCVGVGVGGCVGVGVRGSVGCMHSLSDNHTYLHMHTVCLLCTCIYLPIP